ncbi:MAG: hypothetical protein II919_08805 [Lachnospiraceae bacterium]|nr:hypothetical protein [Lachnospiraceae bacterium]
MLSRLYSKYLKHDLGILIFYMVLLFICSNFPILSSIHYSDNITFTAYCYLFLNSSICIYATILAPVEAFRQFGFLYDRSRIDFYYSLPLTRNKLFFTKYLTGLFYVLVPFTLNMLFGLIVCSLAGIVQQTMFHILFSILFEWIFFTMCYTICVFIMIITGKIAFYILCVLLANYLSILVYYTFRILLTKYFYHWLMVERTTVLEKTLSGLRRLSPVIHYYTAIIIDVDWEIDEYNDMIYHVNLHSVTKYFPEYLLFFAVFLSLSVLLFNRLHTENCSKALTFSKSERPVQVFLSVMFGILFGGTCADSYVAQYDSLTEYIFMISMITLITVVILHSMMEVSYTGEIKKIFRHKWQLFFCFLLALLGALQPLIQY